MAFFMDVVPERLPVHAPVNGPTPVYIEAALNRLGSFSKEHTKLGGRSGEERGVIRRGGNVDGFDQNMLYARAKFSNNKQKNFRKPI